MSLGMKCGLVMGIYLPNVCPIGIKIIGRNVILQIKLPTNTGENVVLNNFVSGRSNA